MKRLTDFQCTECQTIHEHFWDDGQSYPDCKCGGESNKLPNMVPFAFVRGKGKQYGLDTPSKGAISFGTRRVVG
jgi:hypothetical protein